jgi:hypothetical protein
MKKKIIKKMVVPRPIKWETPSFVNNIMEYLCHDIDNK